MLKTHTIMVLNDGQFSLLDKFNKSKFEKSSETYT